MATKSAMPYNNDASLRACAKECKVGRPRDARSRPATAPSPPLTSPHAPRQDCEMACAETMVSCLGAGGKHAAPEHILLVSSAAALLEQDSAKKQA